MMLRIAVQTYTQETENEQKKQPTKKNVTEIETTTDTENELQLLRIAIHECSKAEHSIVVSSNKVQRQTTEYSHLSALNALNAFHTQSSVWIHPYGCRTVWMSNTSDVSYSVWVMLNTESKSFTRTHISKSNITSNNRFALFSFNLTNSVDTETLIRTKTCWNFLFRT